MNIPIYITHYTPLKERRIHMDKQLGRFNLTPTYITKYDRENLIHQDIVKYVGYRKNNESITYTIKLSEISLLCKHMHIYETMIKDDIPEAIVFEDDITLYDDFDSKFIEYYKQLPDDWDIFYFGSGWNLHVPKKVVEEKGGNVFLKGNNGIGVWSPEHKNDKWPICSGSTRCMDSYLITKKGAQKILNYYKTRKFNTPFDIHLNQCFRDMAFKTYWGEPSLCKQDTFQSSIKSTN